MCGIHGFISGKKANTNADDFVRNGFVAGSLRGNDSAGIASISLDKWNTAWQKLPVSGPMFTGEKFAAELIRKASSINTLTICHTRAATTGGIGISEAHPFFVDGENADSTARELIGVHNGTLNNWATKKHGNQYKVDSEWALNHLFDNGMKAFEDFSGAYCFVWWDSNDMETVNFALNNERPMFVVLTELDGMAYASEAGMLHWLCERNNIKMKGDLLKLEGGNHYKFNCGDLANYTKEKLPEVKYTAASSASSTPYKGYKQYKTSMEEVEELLTSLGVGKSKPTLDRAVVADDGRVKIAVYRSEVDAARELTMLNTKGKFQPISTTADGHIEGLVTLTEGGEFDAIMRHASKSYPFVISTVWDVFVLGVKDQGTSIELVTTRPQGQVDIRTGT